MCSALSLSAYASILLSGDQSGENFQAFPPFVKGLPDYVRLKNVAVKKKTRGDFSL